MKLLAGLVPSGGSDGRFNFLGLFNFWRLTALPSSWPLPPITRTLLLSSSYHLLLVSVARATPNLCSKSTSTFNKTVLAQNLPISTLVGVNISLQLK